MTVVSVDKNPAELTMTITSEFAAPVERVWQIWQDPRQLERWWGPPTYPATVVDHDLAPGGAVNYFMTGPQGDKHHGWWRVIAVDPPHLLEFKDGFSDENGQPDDGMPTVVMQVRLASSSPGTTTMTLVSTFPSTEAMEQILAMGAEEGVILAQGQIDGLLAGTAT